MSEAEHIYAPPATAASTVPAEVARYLDGTDLLAKTQALRLSTVDAAGWPHAALLSPGDMVALPSGRIRFVLFPQSATTSNLTRDGRISLTLALDGGMCELRMRARRLAHSSPDVPLAFFEAEVETARTHVAPYADVTGGITFALHDPQAVLPRWQRQIAAMRAAA
jgi:pyridoxamine 5'-phosphate oxidase-like protein